MQLCLCLYYVNESKSLKVLGSLRHSDHTIDGWVFFFFLPRHKWKTGKAPRSCSVLTFLTDSSFVICWETAPAAQSGCTSGPTPPEWHVVTTGGALVCVFVGTKVSLEPFYLLSSEENMNLLHLSVCPTRSHTDILKERVLTGF